MKALVVLIGIWAAGASYAAEPQPTTQQVTQYTCPMHPQVKSDHPGECPICHMKLVRVKSTSPAPQPSPERKLKFYRHPMDPTIHSKVPAKDSMGMDYIPVYEEPIPSGSNVEGRAPVTLTPEQLRLSGTRIVSVERRDLVKEVRVPGRALGGDRVSFQVYENDLGFIRTGLAFEAEAPALPGERLKGKVTSIESILDPMTRTARVNGEMSRKGTAPLRSESSLSATLQVRVDDAIAVPESAILHAGSKDLVFVSTGEGGFTPRAVTLGTKAQGYYEIKEGISEDEKVSAGPNFLLDSESRIQFSYDSPNH